MPTGHYQRKPRVERITIACPRCGKLVGRTPGFIKQHPAIRYCSRACAALDQRQPSAYAEATCGQCGRAFTRQIRRLARAIQPFCSKQCAYASRRVPGAKWRDPEQIRQYNREYHKKNRSRLNANAQKWKKANRALANVNQRRRRASGGTLTAKQWETILTVCPFCVRCGFEGVRMEADHVRPVTQGGTNDPMNIQPLCRSCNASKSDREIDYRSEELKSKLFHALYAPLTIREV